MKDKFNEGQPNIIHSFALHPFLTGPQILLVFITNTALIKCNLSKKENLPSLSKRVQITPYS